MPILIRHLEGELLSYLASGSTNVGEVILIKSVVGEVGLEDYFLLAALEGFTQDFSAVIDAEFCAETPTLIGPTNCPTYIELNISY